MTCDIIATYLIFSFAVPVLVRPTPFSFIDFGVVQLKTVCFFLSQDPLNHINCFILGKFAVNDASFYSECDKTNGLP